VKFCRYWLVYLLPITKSSWSRVELIFAISRFYPVSRLTQQNPLFDTSGPTNSHYNLYLQLIRQGVRILMMLCTASNFQMGIGKWEYTLRMLRITWKLEVQLIWRRQIGLPQHTWLTKGNLNLHLQPAFTVSIAPDTSLSIIKVGYASCIADY
jgi:hypothetical protein